MIFKYIENLKELIFFTFHLKIKILKTIHALIVKIKYYDKTFD